MLDARPQWGAALGTWALSLFPLVYCSGLDPWTEEVAELDMFPFTMQEFAMAIPSLNTASYSADSLPTALAPTAARWFFFFTQCPASSWTSLDMAQTGHGTFLQSSGSQSLITMSLTHVQPEKSLNLSNVLENLLMNMRKNLNSISKNSWKSELISRSDMLVKI